MAAPLLAPAELRRAERHNRIVPPTGQILELEGFRRRRSDLAARAISFMLAREGFYANHPKDPGGETWRGIARRFHPTWEGWQVVDELKHDPAFRRGKRNPAGLEELVRRFYLALFWKPNRCGEFPYPVALPLFDFAVNSPAVQARKALQRTVGTKADGVIGPATLRAAKDRLARRGAHAIGMGVTDIRLQRYLRRVKSHRASEAFLLGWTRRLHHVVAEIHK